MTYKALHLYFSYQTNIHTYLQKNFQELQEYNLIELFQKMEYKEVTKFLENLIKNQQISHLCITLDNANSSLNFHQLKKLKEVYNFKLILIPNDSLNSFEHMDRYYGQIADLILLDATPYIKEFYMMLEIPTLCYSSSHRSELKTKHIFSSSLTQLNKNNNKQYFSSISENKHFFELLESSSITTTQFLDTKFIDSQNIYSIYWIIYHLFINKNYKNTFFLLKLKYFQQIPNILRLLKTMYREDKLQKAIPIDIINKALYKEYKL